MTFPHFLQDRHPAEHGHIELQYESVEGSPRLFMRDSHKTGDPVILPRDREPKPEQMLTHNVLRLVVVTDDQNTSTHRHLLGGVWHSLC